MPNLIYKLLALFLTLNISNLTVLSQTKGACPIRSNIVREKNRPTVYLIFEKDGKRKPKYEGESAEGIWLRLYNNTAWAIHIYTEGYYEKSMFSSLLICGNVKDEGLRNGLEVAPLYYVEATNDNVAVPKINRGHRHLDPSIWLPSGHSLLFSVPREHLAKFLQVSIWFSYEWEWERVKGGRLERDSQEPLHVVSFNNQDLPEQVRQY